MNRTWRSVAMRVAVLLVLGAPAACAPAMSSAREPVPCRDSMYLRLKAVPPDSLSEREFQRLHDLEQSCAQARMAAHGGGMGAMGGMHGGAWWWLAMPAMMVVGALMWLMMR